MFWLGKLAPLYPPGIAEVKKAAEAGIDLQKILNDRTAASATEIMKLQKLEIPYEFKTFLGFQLNNLYDFFMLFVIMAGCSCLYTILSNKVVA